MRLGTIGFAMPLILFLSQTPTAASQSFEVASIKPSTTQRIGGALPVRSSANRFQTTGASLSMILQFAYRTSTGRALRRIDIIGAPSWIDTDAFDIEAKAEGDGERTPDQIRLMVKSLLADRFQLKTHWESRDMDVYNLVVAKDGVRLKASQPPVQPQRMIAMPSPSGVIRLTLTNNAMTMAEFTNWLQSYAGRAVVDKTNTAGAFDIQLQFILETMSTAPPQSQPLPSDPAGPSIFTAIQEQLGLKLESAKGAVEVLVIDHAEKPSAN